MQLRTLKKPKTKFLDESYSIKNTLQKDIIDKEIIQSSNDHSNLTNENEKSRHKLRNTCNNFKGKYQKMNSGKYLYKVNSDRKPITSKKKHLKHFNQEIIQIFKKIILKLNKKEDEILLNKKKKKDDIRPRSEILDNKKKLKQFTNLRCDYNMMKQPQQYEIFYHHQFLDQLRNQGMPIDNSQLIYGMNKEFIKMNSNELMYQFQDNVLQYEDRQPNIINYERITKEGINNIAAAFFINNIQIARNKKIEDEVKKEELIDKGFKNIDLNDATNNQLSMVNDLMKLINEKHKITDIIEKDFSNK